MRIKLPKDRRGGDRKSAAFKAARWPQATMRASSMNAPTSPTIALESPTESAAMRTSPSIVPLAPTESATTPIVERNIEMNFNNYEVGDVGEDGGQNDGDDPDGDETYNPDTLNLEGEEDEIESAPDNPARDRRRRYIGPAADYVLNITKRLRKSDVTGKGVDHLWTKIRGGDLWIHPPDAIHKIHTDVKKGLEPNPIHFASPKIFVFAPHESFPAAPFRCPYCGCSHISPKGWADAPRRVYGLTDAFFVYSRM
jgi:hypothetical protein